MRLIVYKPATLLERISYRLRTMSNSYVLSKLRNIRRYYRENALENCHDDLKPVIIGLFDSVFDYKMFHSEKTSEAMKPSKEAAKRYCLLSLAHMTSKLARNSKDYPQEAVLEIRDFLNDIGYKAEEIQNISTAAMEPFVDNVKSVFNADMVISNGNYNRINYVKNARALVNSCFDNPNSLGPQDVDEAFYKNRDIEPGDIDIRREDIDAQFNKFLEKINGNIFGIDSLGVNRTALNLLNLINGYDDQVKKEVEDFNRKIPVEDFYGYKDEIDPQSFVDSINRKK